MKFEREEDPGNYQAWNVSIAYWLLILLYLPAWLGTVAWWNYRNCRALNSSEQDGRGDGEKPSN